MEDKDVPKKSKLSVPQSRWKKAFQSTLKEEQPPKGDLEDGQKDAMADFRRVVELAQAKFLFKEEKADKALTKVLQKKKLAETGHQKFARMNSVGGSNTVYSNVDAWTDRKAVFFASSNTI